MIAILDIDGTLVDTNYQHALAWYRAFREHGVVLPIWELHRHLGMGGDQFVAAVTDEATDRRIGDAVRDAQGRHYAAAIDEVSLMPGARDLLAELRGRGDTIVLASSAKPEEAGHYLDLLGARELVDAWTTAADVSASKPAPDLVHEALDRVGGQSADAVMIGDSPWDVRAAKQAGVITVAVLTGGFGAEELREAGAIAVFRSVVELCEALHDTPLLR